MDVPVCEAARIAPLRADSGGPAGFAVSHGLEARNKKPPQSQGLVNPSSEADGIRTRNHRIDSPEL